MEINKYTTYCRGLKDHEEYCLPDDVNKLISDHKAVVETMQNKIEELKAVIGGEYTGYYCAEHGAINGVEVTYYEKCAICGRDANHIPEGIK